MNHLAGASVVIGLIGLAFETMPWGLLILAGLVWFATVDLRKPKT
jgi:hypothetical protein